MGAINRGFFYDYIRAHLFGGKLTAKQVAGSEALLDHWEASYAAHDDRWLAYILATAFHETDKTMQPIREYGSTAYFDRRYGPPPEGGNAALAKALGNTEKGDGALFCGRGFVQLTGRRNYVDWSQRLGVNLTAEPDLCLELKHAVWILVEGSVQGTFTGKKLADYFGGPRADWRGARRIINGLDKADLIAGHARQFYASICYTE